MAGAEFWAGAGCCAGAAAGPGAGADAGAGAAVAAAAGGGFAADRRGPGFELEAEFKGAPFGPSALSKFLMLQICRKRPFSREKSWMFFELASFKSDSDTPNALAMAEMLSVLTALYIQQPLLSGSGES